MSGPSLWWIDWSLLAGPMKRDTAARLLLLFLASLYFLVLLLSGGVNRFISGQYAITAVMRTGVADEEGEGIAGKIAGLDAVGEAVYRDPEQAWKEFLAAYPGLESVRRTGGNPLPGYVEVRIRPERFSLSGIKGVTSALQAIPQVENVLWGEDAMPRLLQIKGWINAILWAGFGLLCAGIFLLFVMQETFRSARLLPDVAFLLDRGVPSGRIAAGRAAGASLTSAALSLVSGGAAALLVHFLIGRFRLLRSAMAPLEELLTPRGALFLGLFLLSAIALPGLASLIGWRAAGSARK